VSPRRWRTDPPFTRTPADPAKAAEALAIGTRVITKFADDRKGEGTDVWFELA